MYWSPSMLYAVGAFIAFTFSSQTAAAQQHGIITGTISGSNERPVARARVSLASTDAWTLAGADGTFRFDSVSPGLRTLEVRMLGYSPVSLPVEILPGESLHISASLIADAVALKTVEVRAEAGPAPLLRGFEDRRARGAGKFFTREDIQRMQPRLFTDVLRRVAGMHISPVSGPFGTSYTVQFGRSRASTSRSCPALFYVNGVPFPVTPDVAINHFVSPEDVAGVEVYAGLAEVPAQFNSSMHNARCGVIVVWTYGGEGGRPGPAR